MIQQTKSWLDLACQRSVVLRSARVALLVGTVLLLINYLDRILISEITWADLLKILLTYLVPYCVSTYASVAAMREGERDHQSSPVQ